jgi:hypothetical protein
MHRFFWQNFLLLCKIIEEKAGFACWAILPDFIHYGEISIPELNA